MNKWLPAVGELCYVTCNTVHKRAVEDREGNVVTIMKVTDGSYRDCIFRMVSSDDTCIVLTKVYGGYSNGNPLMLRRAAWDITPVGPNIAESLGLQSTNEE